IQALRNAIVHGKVNHHNVITAELVGRLRALRRKIPVDWYRAKAQGEAPFEDVEIHLAVPLGPEPHQWGVVEITVGKETTAYFLQRLTSDFGPAFKLTKKDTGDSYDVNLSPEKPSCECKGFLRWQHCKHVEGLLALQQAGRL